LILVLFGTSPYGFDKLAKAVEDFAVSSGEEMVAQSGNTNYCPKNVRCFDFMPREKLISLIDESELVITQGGFGSIMDCLDRRKKVVAVPRTMEAGECRHGGLGQEELVRQLEKEGKVVGVYDVKNLPDAIKRARMLQPRFEANTVIPKLVFDFVKTVIK
jgi:UDP-N-acetylglucosamine transferase subunit ALG13